LAVSFPVQIIYRIVAYTVCSTIYHRLKNSPEEHLLEHSISRAHVWGPPSVESMQFKLWWY